tara:strand:- start:161 stop:847 length:687 start_codon:yes stop_codon:yes gene_type:complete
MQRAKRSKLADIVVLCTSTNEEDINLCKIAKKNGILSFQGPLDDKVQRWLNAAQHYNVEYFVNIDGDDLFCEPELIDMAFLQYEKEGHDFVKTDESKLIVGAFTLGAKTEAIQKICEMKDTEDTEAAWLSFSELDIFNTKMLEGIPEVFERPEIRATLDYEEDFLFFKTIIEYFFDKEKFDFSLRDVVKYVNINKDILTINQDCQERYLSNQKKLTKLVLKTEEVKSE